MSQSLELFLLDGSNWSASVRTLERVRNAMPRGFFTQAHLCSSFALLPTLPFTDATLHRAEIEYGNRRAYSQYVLRELPKLVTADHFMIIHRDGYPLNPEKWEDEFLKYDFIGAPWGPEPEAVGNGGFCIRSRRLALWAAERPMTGTDNEDWHLCVHLRAEALAAGFTFAPVEVAARFSLENAIESLPRTRADVFGFHGTHDRLDLLL